MRLKSNIRNVMRELEAEKAERHAAMVELRGQMPAPAPIPPPAMPAVLDLGQIAPMPPTEESPLLHSAPVSRSDSGLGGSNYSSKPLVTLSPEQMEHCRLAGIDPLTYAKGVLRLKRELKAGMRQNG